MSLSNAIKDEFQRRRSIIKRAPFILHAAGDEVIELEEKCPRCSGEGRIRPDDKQWEELKRRVSKDRSDTFLGCYYCNGSGLIISDEGKTLLAFIKQYENKEEL